jgi:hypothetical protein
VVELELDEDALLLSIEAGDGDTDWKETEDLLLEMNDSGDGCQLGR